MADFLEWLGLESVAWILRLTPDWPNTREHLDLLMNALASIYGVAIAFEVTKHWSASVHLRRLHTLLYTEIHGQIERLPRQAAVEARDAHRRLESIQTRP